MENDMHLSPEDALKEFLLDIDHLDPLTSKTSFNPFDVLKITRTEIRHSNVLAWLLDSGESHGLGSGVLSELLNVVVKEKLVDTETAFKLLTLPLSDVVVYREMQNIDILVEVDNKCVICIENKVDTQDHDDQLNRYYQIITNRYTSLTKLFLYLTPGGAAPLHDDNTAWNTISYETVCRLIHKAATKVSLRADVKAFIDSYLDVLRREIMEDKEITKLCQDIYRKHRQALDLIFENRPDRLQNVSVFFREWSKKRAKEKVIVFDEEKCSKSYCRFRTPYMDGIMLPCEGNSGWGVLNHYFYEICSYLDKNGNVKYYIQMAFSAANLNQAQLEQIRQIDAIVSTGKRTLKKNWQWRASCATETATIKESDILPDDPGEANEIYNNLDKMFATILKWEEKIKSELEKI